MNVDEEKAIAPPSGKIVHEIKIAPVTALILGAAIIGGIMLIMRGR